MLLGNFQGRLDPKKGRTALPAKFRQFIGKKIILTQGHERTLMIIAPKSWASLTDRIVNRPFISAPARDIDRFLLGNAYELALDNQGRFIIPSQLRTYARLNEKIVFVGMGNRIELWDQNRWEKRLSYLQENISQITARLDKGESRQ